MMTIASSFLSSLPPIITRAKQSTAADADDYSEPRTQRDSYRELPDIPGAQKKTPKRGSKSSKEKLLPSFGIGANIENEIVEGDSSDDDSDNCSGSSYSSYSESVMSKGTAASVISINYNAKQAIALTATATTHSIILSATKSAKLTKLERHLKEDMQNDAKQVLIAPGAVVPHVKIIVDDEYAHELKPQARLHDAPRARQNGNTSIHTHIGSGNKSTVHNGITENTGHTAGKTAGKGGNKKAIEAQKGVPAQGIDKSVHHLEAEVTAGCAKQTVCTGTGMDAGMGTGMRLADTVPVAKEEHEPTAVVLKQNLL